MSEFKLQDGTGSGYLQKVDDHGRAWVSANMVTHEQHHAAYHENLFAATFEVTLADTNEAPVAFYIQTSSANQAEIYRFFLTSPSNCQFRIYSGDTYSAGGESVTPTNMTRGSGKSLGGTFYQGGTSDDLVVTSTDRVIMFPASVIAYDTREINMGGGLICKNSNGFTITAQGTATDVVSVSVLMAEHSDGYQL